MLDHTSRIRGPKGTSYPPLTPKKIYEFAQEFTAIFPTATFVKRKPQFDLKTMSEIGMQKGFTDLLVLHENKKKIDGLTICHLPAGPTAYFKLSSIKLNKEIRGHGNVQ